MRPGRAFAAAWVAGGLGAAGACLDPTPVTIAARAPVDAAGEGSAHDLVARCNACLAASDTPGPGCGTETAACSDMTGCTALVDCATSLECFEQGSIGRVESCGLPCASDSGVAPGDPSFNALLAVFSCAIGTCGPACGIAEAGP
jgi:hypothetical protein